MCTKRQQIEKDFACAACGRAAGEPRSPRHVPVNGSLAVLGIDDFLVNFPARLVADRDHEARTVDFSAATLQRCDFASIAFCRLGRIGPRVSTCRRSTVRLGRSQLDRRRTSMKRPAPVRSARSRATASISGWAVETNAGRTDDD
jgi:hypothetical protein